MRADIVPGNKFPDFELTDTDKGRHHLSERLRGPFQGLQQTPTREEGHVVTGHWRPRAAFALIAALILALGIAACGGSNDNNPTGTSGGTSANLIKSNPANNGVQLTVGSKNFTEEFILGNIYAQALKAAGYNVSTNLNLGSEVIAYKALQDGQVSGYPEYTSTLLQSIFGKTRVPADSLRRRERARDLDQQSAAAWGHHDLRPAGQVTEPDSVRVARVPPAHRLPGRAAERLRPPVQVVQPGRHRAPIHRVGQGPGGPFDRVHLRCSALR